LLNLLSIPAAFDIKLVADRTATPEAIAIADLGISDFIEGGRQCRDVRRHL
jgi:hypothetical protein